MQKISILFLTFILMFVNIIPVYATNIIMNGQYVYTEEILETEVPEINNISEALDEVDANSRQLEHLGNFFITYYCPCGRCNGYDKYGNPRSYDRYGDPLVWGTVAVDPKVIPLQTHLVIDGYDVEFVAKDTGGKWVQGKHVDIYVPVSHKEAANMCTGQRLNVWKIIE